MYVSTLVLAAILSTIGALGLQNMLVPPSTRGPRSPGAAKAPRRAPAERSREEGNASLHDRTPGGPPAGSSRSPRLSEVRLAGAALRSVTATRTGWMVILHGTHASGSLGAPGPLLDPGAACSGPGWTTS